MKDSHSGKVAHFCHFFPRVGVYSTVNAVIIDHNNDHRQIIPGKKEKKKKLSSSVGKINMTAL